MELALPAQKNAVRAAMRRQLQELDPARRAAASRRIVRQIVELPVWRAAARVLLFAPLPSEPDLDQLWQDDALAGKRCAYPRVEGAVLRLYSVDSVADLQPTRWGLREPTLQAAREVALEETDLVLVPGLAFTSAGGRLGRGGGFYDRLLANRDPAKTRLIGVGFSFQRIEGTLPLAAHDVRLDEVITD